MKSPIGIEGWTDGRIVEILQGFAKGNKQILEIGVWKGRTTIAMAQETDGLVFAVDTWTGSPSERHSNHKEAADNPLKVYLEFLSNAVGYNVIHKIVPIVGHSTTVLAQMLNGNIFDLAYIDGDHAYPQTKIDISMVWGRLKSGGIICGDDYGWDGVNQAVTEMSEEYKGFNPQIKVDGKLWVVAKP